MSPQTSAMLMEEIAPRLKGAVAHIKPVGCEDRDELLQDGLLMAARMLDANETTGKTVPASSVAYYVCLHLKSGRRSHSAARTDAYGSGTQLDGKSAVLSLESEIGYDPETCEPIHLGEMLSCSQDDPASVALRNIDWQDFLDSHDYRYGVILRDIAQGRTALDIARDCGDTYFHIRQLKEKLEADLREYLGASAVADSVRMPSWRGNIHAGREKSACKRH